MGDDYTEDALKKHRDLLIACGWGKEVDVILLLQQGASVRVQDQDGKNCLHYAACKGHIQVANLLIENGCAINARDKCNRTPLHLAAEEGHHDIVSILLDNNADFDVQDEEGNTPCHVACLNDHVEVTELLIHIKADLNLRNKDGFTPLHVATVNHHTKTMTLLIKTGVNKNAQDTRGNTPMHLAVQTKSLKVLKCLVNNGADVNTQNYDGNTALHLCSDYGNTQFVECLLSTDQSVELSPNNIGDTAKDIAIRHGFREIVLMIPDPYKKKKVKRRVRGPDSPASPNDSQISPATPPTDDKEIKKSPHRKHKYNRTLETPSPNGFVQHPSEEIPSVTSSSMTSLWVPTTDSGISLPMDAKGDRAHTFTTSSLRRKQKKEIKEKPRLFNELQQYDSHSRRDSKRYQRRDKLQTHEYEELRYDPRFMSPQITTKRHSSKHNGTSQMTQYHTIDRNFKEKYHDFIDHGSLSDDSIQYKGCFFKSKLKKGIKNGSTKTKQKLSDVNEKELLIHRQAELQYQLGASKHSLEKQMRKMRKRFEKALQATDERFVEQKKREEEFHNQLRSELEFIENTLEKGSKKNVEEFTQHIKIELNRLTEKLTRGLDLNSNESTEELHQQSCESKMKKRASAVDLDRDISVRLPKNDPKAKLSVEEVGTASSKRVKIYEQRLKELEKEAKEKELKEKENEALRARVLELEQLIKSERSKNS